MFRRHFVTGLLIRFPIEIALRVLDLMITTQMLRKDETIELDMRVDQALKYIVSMGVVAPLGRVRPLSRRALQEPKAEIS